MSKEDTVLCIAIKVAVKTNMPDKYNGLLAMEKSRGVNIGVVDYQMWVDENVPLESMEAAAIFSIAYGKTMTEVVELMKSRQSRM